MNLKQSPQEIENKVCSFWNKKKIYKFNPKKKGVVFAIDTPPPTISGKMHIGHVFSYAQEDFIARYLRMTGKNVFYPFGTDDNGLPTEKLIEKENKVKIFKMKRKDFINLCQKTLKKIRPQFIQDWKDIGMSCDFNLYYSTISKEVQRISQEYFLDLYKKKRVYKKEAPTLWCPQCRTAIAQADLEDQERKSFLNYIKVKIIDTDNYITFATTRPELLPACVGVSVHPQDKRFKKFIGMKVKMPITGAEISIIPDEKTDMKYGTGVVYYCTYGGVECIDWMLRHPDVKPINIMGSDGKYNEKAGKYAGLSNLEARKKIIEDLKKTKALVKQESITHIVNTHERCGTDVEFVSTEQWFIKYLDLKKDFLKMGNKMNWFPPHMKKRYENWILGLRWDWCISRQRYFGIPFPVWYCKKCKKIILAEKKDLPIDPISQKPKSGCSCGSKEFIAEKDVLDTWATSSLTPQIAISLVKNKKVQKKLFPMLLRPQGHDIINFWLFYTVARSKIHFNKIPWKNIMISGFVLDSKGEKMSKSKGNVVSPQEMIKKYGADVLRHWACKAGLGEDLRWNEEEINSSKKTTIKLQNASKFCISHLKNFNYKKLQNKKLENEDKWILDILQETIKKYHYYFKKYDFKKAREEIDQFFWRKFCDYYLEIIKPRLYEKEYEKKSQIGAKFTLVTCFSAFLKLYAPFMPFLTEKIFQEYFKNKKEISIHQSLFPKENPVFSNLQIKKEFDLVIDIIDQVRKYKSKKGISLKGEISSLELQTKDKKFQKYFFLLSKIMNIKKIETKKILKGDLIKINNNFKIQISL